MTNGQNVHWRVRFAQTRKWKDMVHRYFKLNPKPAQPLISAALTLTRHSSNEPDFDGLVSGFKHVIDGLVECGVLVNDKTSTIGQPTYRWMRAAPKKGRVEIEIRY